MGLGIENSHYLIKTDFFYKLGRYSLYGYRLFLSCLAINNPHDTHNKNKHHKYRQNIRHIALHKPLYLKTLAGIGFIYEVIPAPALFRHTEQNEYKRAERKNEVADYSILKVKYRASCAERLKTAENIESQTAGN